MKIKKRNQATQLIEDCKLEEVLGFLDSHDEIECDTETWGFDPHLVDILCIQFGDRNNQYLIEWEDILIDILKPYFEDPTKTFLFQNAKFDLQFLYKKKIVVANVYDTLLAETILTIGSQFGNRGLDALVKKYANAHMSKEIRDIIVRVGLTEAVIDYALDDVKYLSIIKEQQMVKIRELNLETALNLDNNFVKVLAYIEFCGIGFSKDKWLAKCQREEIEWKEKQDKLNELVIETGLMKYQQYGTLFDPPGTVVCTLNWSAPKQVAQLFKDLNIDIQIEEEGEFKESVGKQVLQKYKDNPLVNTFSDYIKLNKRLTSFGRDYLGYINQGTGRVHTSYKQILNTGRMSSGNKRFGHPNLQQVPADEEHRECFIAEPGNKMICTDYTGQEAVIFANKCQDENLLAFYDNDLGDMHSYVASLCFPGELAGVGLKDIKKQRPDLRQLAKAAGFAIQFGGNGYTISNNLGISEEEGDNVYNSYTEAFPGMFDYFKKISQESEENGYATFNPITKRKFFFDFIDEYRDLKKKINKEFWAIYRQEKEKESLKYENYYRPMVKKFFKYKGVLERTSYNFPVQGSGADCTKYGAYLFFKWLQEENLMFDVKIVNIVHDELLVECREEIAEMISEKVQYFLEKAASFFCKRVPLSASPQVADCWVH